MSHHGKEIFRNAEKADKHEGCDTHRICCSNRADGQAICCWQGHRAKLLLCSQTCQGSAPALRRLPWPGSKASNAVQLLAQCSTTLGKGHTMLTVQIHNAETFLASSAANRQPRFWACFWIIPLGNSLTYTQTQKAALAHLLGLQETLLLFNIPIFTKFWHWYQTHNQSQPKIAGFGVNSQTPGQHWKPTMAQSYSNGNTSMKISQLEW